MGKYFVTADPPAFVGRSQYESLGLSGKAIELLFDPFYHGTLSRYKNALREQGAVIFENGDSTAIGSELRNGMVLFLHMPSSEQDRLVRMLWNGNLQAPRALWPDWKRNEFDMFVKPEQVTLDEVIDAGRVFSDGNLASKMIIEDDSKNLAEDSFYIIRLTLHRKRWPWKWITPLLYDYISSRWWYWTFGIIPICERAQRESR
jgi:hypothetical protein